MGTVIYQSEKGWIPIVHYNAFWVDSEDKTVPGGVVSYIFEYNAEEHDVRVCAIGKDAMKHTYYHTFILEKYKEWKLYLVRYKHAKEAFLKEVIRVVIDKGPQSREEIEKEIQKCIENEEYLRAQKLQDKLDDL